VTLAAHASKDSRSSSAFVLLVRLFISRVFHDSGASEYGELDLGIGVILALLALPGAFYSLFMLEKYSTLLQWMQRQHELDPLAGALSDEYFFLVLSMVITGVVAVWRWDRIFPDRRDYMNLVPLPIPLKKIFWANLTAIVLLALLLAVDVNAASAFLFPLVVSASENTFGFFFRFVTVHTSVVVLASIFSFCAVFVIVGALMVAFPYQAFRRFSLYLRALILAGFVALLSTSFAIPPMLKNLPGSWIRFLPPVWFLALCQEMRGRATEGLTPLAHVALIFVVAVVVAGILIYSASYSRRFVRIPETSDVQPAAASNRGGWFFKLADHIVLRSPLQRAVYRFAINTLVRNENHGLLLGGFLGLGVVLASQLLFASFSSGFVRLTSPSPDILAIPLALSYCIILGLRFAFEIPAELPANWIFRIHVPHTTSDCAPLAGRVMLTFVFPWTLAIVLPVYIYLWGWRVGMVHTVVVALCSLLLTQILLHDFHKIPFTCSYPSFGQSAILMVLLYVIGFFGFVTLTSHVEHWVMRSSVGCGAVVFALATLCVAVPRFGRNYEEEMTKTLLFDEAGPVAFELLDLHRGS
jgi:hypothetical protein